MINTSVSIEKIDDKVYESEAQNWNQETSTDNAKDVIEVTLGGNSGVTDRVAG